MFLQRAPVPSRNTPPPVQPLDRDLPKSPVLMLPSAQNSPPRDCLALTWVDHKQDEVPVSPSKSLGTVVPYSSPDANSMYEQSRAFVFDSPAGGRTVCLQKTVCYSLPPNVPLGSPGAPSGRHGSPGGGDGGGSTSGSPPHSTSFVGSPGRNSLLDGSGKERKGPSGTPPVSGLGSGRSPPSDQAASGQQPDSQVRKRYLQKGWKDLHLPKDDRAKPGRKLSGSDRYRDILEQDHPEETLSRGLLGSCFCFVIPLILLVAVVLALLVWFGATVSLLGVLAPADRCPDLNVSHVRQELERGLIGQPVASKLVVEALDGCSVHGGRPIIMFFHGSSGVGKSHTANLITESILDGADMAKCVHLFSTDLFLRSAQAQPMQVYTRAVEEWMNGTGQGRSQTCCTSFFIFDELQADAPQDLTRALGHALSKLHSSAPHPRQRQIFIVMTTVGAQAIGEFLAANMRRGQDRNSLSLEKPNWREPWRHLAASLDKQDPFWTYLPPDAYLRVPFLPLERAHVKECAHRSLERKNLTATSEHVDWVADQLVYHPDTWPSFSTSGCKKVAGKVDLIRKDSQRNSFDFKKPF